MRMAIRADLPIVFADEILFTKRAVYSKEYCKARAPIAVPQAEWNFKPVGTVAFICRDKGLLHWDSVPKDCNSEIFFEHVKVVRRKMGNKPFFLYLDLAGFHRSRWLKEQMEEINITRILSVPASPEYNPIEGCFSIVKNYFKR